MSELVCLELSVLLWLAHVFVQGGIGVSIHPPGYLATARDKGVKTDNVYYARATRAIANYVENLAPFVALDLALIVTNHAGGWGATVWIVSRILYLPLYVFGVPWLRSVVWTTALAGLLMMLARLAF